MLIKNADDQTGYLAELQRLTETETGAVAKRHSKKLAMRKAGIKGEAESAYLIDFHFKDTPNWAVIHDLRLEHESRVAQIDHLLINRWMKCYVLESKHFNAGVKITENGEFMRWNDYRRTYEGMLSPLEQNERHIAVLSDVMRTLRLPVRFGRAINFSFQTIVLVSPGARIDRPKDFDTSRVIKADQLRQAIKRDIDHENGLLGIVRTAARIVSADTLRDVAKQLAQRHKPASRRPVEPIVTVVEVPRNAGLKISKVSEPPAPPYAADAPARVDVRAESPVCKGCGKGNGSILYGKYGYYFRCAACEANTAIRFKCREGHKPRLRKQGDHFYRTCSDCGPEQLYFRNASAA